MALDLLRRRDVVAREQTEVAEQAVELRVGERRVGCDRVRLTSPSCIALVSVRLPKRFRRRE